MFKSQLQLLVFLTVAMMVPVSASKAADPFSAVTYNIRYANPGDGPDFWPDRAEAVADFLQDHDLFGLQEVTRSQLDDLVESLDGFDHYGVGRDDGKSGGEHAPIFYRKNRFDVVDQGTFWLSETPSKVGVKGWDAALPRTCTWMKLRDKVTDNTFLVANTHFDHRGVEARKQSGSLIVDELSSRGGDLPIVLMGDFNCQPGSDPYVALTRKDGFSDARDVTTTEATGPGSTWNGFKEIADGRIIDHVFVRGPVTVQSHETLDPRTAKGRFASDHLPVRCQISLVATPKS